MDKWWLNKSGLKILILASLLPTPSIEVSPCLYKLVSWRWIRPYLWTHNSIRCICLINCWRVVVVVSTCIYGDYLKELGKLESAVSACDTFRDCCGENSDQVEI